MTFKTRTVADIHSGDFIHMSCLTIIPEYTGQVCESEITPCDPDPCLNGGECTSSDVTFTCICQTGYHGDQCELVLNACDRMECEHGGTCIEDGYVGRCECTSWYTGQYCEKGRLLI